MRYSWGRFFLFLLYVVFLCIPRSSVLAQTYKLTIDKPSNGSVEGGSTASSCEKIAGYDSGKIAIVIARSNTHSSSGCDTYTREWKGESEDIDKFKSAALRNGTFAVSALGSESGNFVVYRSDKIDTGNSSTLCSTETQGKLVYRLWVLAGDVRAWTYRGNQSAWACLYSGSGASGFEALSDTLAHEVIGHDFSYLMDEYFVSGTSTPAKPYYNCSASASCEKWKNASFPGGTLVDACTKGCYRESLNLYRSAGDDIMLEDGSSSTLTFSKLQKFIISAYAAKAVNGTPIPSSVESMGESF